MRYMLSKKNVWKEIHQNNVTMVRIIFFLCDKIMGNFDLLYLI